MFAHIRPFKLAAVLAAVTLISSVGVASAAAPCGSHDAIAKSLTTKFKEARRIMGVVNDLAPSWKSSCRRKAPGPCWSPTPPAPPASSPPARIQQEVPIEMTGLDS